MSSDAEEAAKILHMTAEIIKAYQLSPSAVPKKGLNELYEVFKIETSCWTETIVNRAMAVLQNGERKLVTNITWDNYNASFYLENNSVFTPRDQIIRIELIN